MSLSVTSMIQERPAHGSALVIAGMLIAAALIVALSAAFGMGAPDPAALIVGP